MAWFHPELYHRVLAYSPTTVNQAWPHDPALPGGAWQYHDPWPSLAHANLVVQGKTVTQSDLPADAPLIPNSPRKPNRLWFDWRSRPVLLRPSDGRMHDWTLADERTAATLAAEGYDDQFVFVRNAKHADDTVEAQTLPEALAWVWKG